MILVWISHSDFKQIKLMANLSIGPTHTATVVNLYVCYGDIVYLWYFTLYFYCIALTMKAIKGFMGQIWPRDIYPVQSLFTFLPFLFYLPNNRLAYRSCCSMLSTRVYIPSHTSEKEREAMAEFFSFHSSLFFSSSVYIRYYTITIRRAADIGFLFFLPPLFSLQVASTVVVDMIIIILTSIDSVGYIYILPTTLRRVYQIESR